MPERRIVIWNVQNFGSENRLRWGTSSTLRANFIAKYLGSLDVDLVGLIEVMPGAESHLDQLHKRLNAHRAPGNRWAYDWIASALDANAADPPQDEGDTSFFNGGSRSEGYALFWRISMDDMRPIRAARPLSQGTVDTSAFPDSPDHVLDLVTTGRPVEVVHNTWQITGGFPAGGVYAVRGGAPVNPWVNLNFVSAGRGVGYQPRRANSRRPAFAIFELPNNTLCPIQLFHAPSEMGRAIDGTRYSALAREMYVSHPTMDTPFGPRLDTTQLVRVATTLAGGDYNVAYDAASEAYRYFVRNFNAAPTGGARCAALLTPAAAEAPGDKRRKTTVQLKQFMHGRFQGDPIVGANADDFRSMAIDNLFSRGLDNDDDQSGVGNLVAFVMNPGNACQRQIQAYEASLNAIRRTFRKVDPVIGPYTTRRVGRREVKVPAIPDLRNWNRFRTGISRGYFEHARQAAEFVRYYISDHLPLLFHVDLDQL